MENLVDRRAVSKLVKGVRIFLTVQFKVHAKDLTPLGVIALLIL
jgi:hypothetical protein